jgi:hypothetical protein
MNSEDRHTGNVLLLRTACITLLIALVLAWCLVFVGPMKIPAFVDLFKDTDRLLSSHLDYLMMTMLLLGFYGAHVALPAHVRWPMAIGSVTNPLLFLMESMALPPHIPGFRIFVLVSIVLATYGYGMGAITVFRSTTR